MKKTVLYWIVLCLFAFSALVPASFAAAQAPLDDPLPTPEATDETAPEAQSLEMANKLYLPTLVSAPPPASQAPKGYYVATNGSDNAAGTYEKPWRSINIAASRLKPGETLYIRGGIYSEAVNIRVSGTQTAPVKITGYPGETAVIEGSHRLPTNYSGLVSIYGDWVEVRDVEVRNSTYIGVALYGEHNLVSGVFAHHSNKSGITASGDYSIVEKSKAWRNSLLNENSASPNAYSTGITAARDQEDGLTEHAIIRNNHSWENWGQGISTYESSGTIISGNVVHDSYSTNIYISDATNVLCKGNFVYMNPASYVYGHGANVGIMLGDERYKPPSSNITIVNNIAYGNKRNLFWWKGERGFMNNVLIANNTFVNSTYGAGVILNEGDHVNVRFLYNIVAQDNGIDPIALNAGQDIRFANNLWSEAPQKYAVGTGDVIGDPGLMKTGSVFGSDWYRLRADSRAINRAAALPEVTVDFFLVARASQPDIGAVEYK